jgi:hypothetical protein
MMRRVSLGLLLPLLAGCYVNQPLVGSRPEPAPGTRLAIELTDAGRVGMALQVGPEVVSVEGALIERSDSQYVLGVTKVVGLYGAQSRWQGERVAFRAEYVRRMSERRFSPGRTAGAVVGMVAGVVVAMLTNNLVGGGGESPNDKPTPPPNDN